MTLPTALFACLATAAVLLLPGGAARAAALPFEATLTVRFTSVEITSLPVTGVATLDGSGGGMTLSSLGLPAGFLATPGFTQPITDPTAFPIVGLRLTGTNGTGTFARTSGNGLSGLMAFPGTFKLCLFDLCPTAPANISIPLSVMGAGGSGFFTGAVNVTVTGAPWTTGTIQSAFGSVMATGFAHGPLSATGTTGRPGGALRLVTPLFLTTNIPAPVIYHNYGVLDIRFVPEPSGLLLLTAGVMALVLGAQRRASD